LGRLGAQSDRDEQRPDTKQERTRGGIHKILLNTYRETATTDFNPYHGLQVKNKT